MAKNLNTTGVEKFVATLPYLVAPSDEQVDQMEIDFQQNVLCASSHDEKQFTLDWMYEISVWQYDQMYICLPLKVNPYESWLYTMYDFPLNQEDKDIDWLANHPVYGKYFFLDHDRYRVFNFPHMNWFDADTLPDNDLSDIFSQMAEDAPTDPVLYN